MLTPVGAVFFDHDVTCANHTFSRDSSTLNSEVYPHNNYALTCEENI